MNQLCKNFDKLPFEYQEETKKLYVSLEAATSLDEKRNLFENFSQKYTMLPTLWRSWLGLERAEAGTSFSIALINHLFAMEQRALSDFYYYKFMKRRSESYFHTQDFWFSKILDTYQQNCYGIVYKEAIYNPKISRKYAKMYLEFPHRDIESTFNIYRQVLVEPVSKNIIEKYNFNKNLYDKIVAADNNDEEWLKLVTSVNEYDFIQQNVEARIAEDPTNKELWKSYIKYFQNYPEKIQTLLSAYYRYCRLFIDDDEMKYEFEKLQLKVKREEPQILKSSLYLESPNVPTECGKRYYDNSAPLHTVYLQNCSNQCFSFPKTIMTYVMDNGLAETWQKLYQTCKYFFYKNQTPIIHQLRIISGERFDSSNNTSITEVYTEFEKQSLLMTAHNSNVAKCKNAIVSNYLNIMSFQNSNQNSNFLSNLISSLHASQILIIVASQKITIDELDFLVGHGKVEVALLLCQIKDINEEYIPIEDLVAKFPYGRELKFSFAKYNQNSAAQLAELERYAKLEQFRILKVTAVFNVFDYINFAAKNTFPDGLFDVTFNSTVPEDTVAVFRNRVEQSFAGSEVQPWFTITKA